jgi:hypothetical protein
MAIKKIKIKFWPLIGNLNNLVILLIDIYSLLEVAHKKVIGHNEARLQYVVKRIVEDIKILRNNKVFIIKE